MARQVVDLYHGAEAGDAAEARFDQVHREHELPDEIDELPVPEDAVRDGVVYLPRLLVGLGLASSNSEARRLLEQGGVRLDGEPLGGEEVRPETLRGHVLQVGRRRFVRLR
jgi:tyrosyl-tRNA synthetase